MAMCRLCTNSSTAISRELGVCLACIRKRPKDALSFIAIFCIRPRAHVLKTLK